MIVMIIVSNISSHFNHEVIYLSLLISLIPSVPTYSLSFSLSLYLSSPLSLSFSLSLSLSLSLFFFFFIYLSISQSLLRSVPSLLGFMTAHDDGVSMLTADEYITVRYTAIRLIPRNFFLPAIFSSSLLSLY